MNMLGGKSNKADYLVTGSWSEKAMKEAMKYGQIREACPRVAGYSGLPDEKDYDFDPEAAYIYYCENETAYGIEFPEPPTVPEGIPLVCDMSSNMLSRPVDISR